MYVPSNGSFALATSICWLNAGQKVLALYYMNKRAVNEAHVVHVCA